MLVAHIPLDRLDKLETAERNVADLLAYLEHRYVESLNAVIASAPDNESDVNRWRGHAEAYRQTCERIRRDGGLAAVRYTSEEWRTGHGVYTLRARP